MYARETIAPGKNFDGYWTNEDVVRQLENKAIKAFDALHPGQKAVFAFDNSSNHRAVRGDGLCANSLNLSDGGKNTPLMRDTEYTRNGTVHKQKMQRRVRVDGTIVPLQKGVQRILEERGLWQEKMVLECSSKKGGCDQSGTCCGRAVLRNQPDFKAQKCWLEEIVASAGHESIFFPKFHCELNFIERVWSVAKGRARRECDYTFDALQELVPRIMEEIDVVSVRKMAQRCYRYMDAYRYGLSPKLAEYAVSKYTSHRCIPATVEKALEDEELISMLAAEKLAAREAAAAAVVQDAAELAVAVAHAVAHPLHADVPDGVVPFTAYTVVNGVASTPHTRYSRSNTICEQCNKGESDERPFERCERCNLVYHRTCLEPQPQPFGSYLFLCDDIGCRNELEGLLGRPI